MKIDLSKIDDYANWGNGPDSSLSKGNFNKELIKIFKKELYNSWPWLKSICDIDDIPDNVIKLLLNKRLSLDKDVIISKTFLELIVTTINNYCIGFSAEIKNNKLYLIESLENKEGLLKEVKEYLESRDLILKLSGDEAKDGSVEYIYKL